MKWELLHFHKLRVKYLAQGHKEVNVSKMLSKKD